MVTDHSGYLGSHAKSPMTAMAAMAAMAATRLPHKGKLATSGDRGQAFCGTIEANMPHGG